LQEKKGLLAYLILEGFLGKADMLLNLAVIIFHRQVIDMLLFKGTEEPTNIVVSCKAEASLHWSICCWKRGACQGLR